MGKNDLLKSTTKPKKKKAAATKSKAKKKSSSKKATKKAALAKNTSSQANDVDKKTTAKKATAKKPPEKKLTQQELILKKFDSWKPEKLFKAEVDKSFLDNFTAPPFVTAKNQTKKIQELLLKKYDLEEIKAAGEKAAAEKAAAEKAAAEKAAAEKAAAEKAAAEKAAAEKAAAEPIVASNKPGRFNVAKEELDRMKKTIIAFVAFLILVVTPILAASISNSTKYYLHPTTTTLQIWKGDFAPMGSSLLISLPGVAAPEEIKTTYCKKEVFPLAFNYYIAKVDAQAAEPGVPNFGAIETDLNRALCFANSKEMRDIANKRLDSINFLALLYKAEIAAGNKDHDSLNKALGYLKESTLLDMDAHQTQFVDQKIAEIKQLLSAEGTKTEVLSAEETKVETKAEETKVEETE